ncbi:hypothetical protein MSG28_009499, partial [Choristoneura fumiferana]
MPKPPNVSLLWKIYKGYKKSTKQEASIFVFEKKQLEKFTKADRDIMLDTLKRGIVQLTKLRHPQILTVQHSLEESRESLAFATEPVFASLANILGNMENMPQPSNHLNNYKLYELEIKYGLMQVAEGLAFLHNDVKLLHHNISPESIIVNQQGAWKIFGFDFCIANQSTTGSAPFWPFNEYCPAMNALTQPSLDYLAPEYILSASHSPASDIYSLGMLIYATQSPNHRTLGNIGSDYGKFKKFANELRNLPPSRLSCVAEGLREYVKLMLNATPELRPDPHQFLKKLGITKEVMATKVLPFLIPLCVENGLTLNQFNSLITLVKQMVGKVETEHRAKLEQLNSIKDESKLAQQQEVAQRINRQPPPTAIPAPQKTTRPPLDLTSSLLQSNLSALTTQKPQYNINTAQYNQNTSLYNQNTTTTPLYNQNTTTTPVYNQNTTTTPVYNQNTTTPLYNHN